MHRINFFSNLKIRSKVLLFVIPFAASILIVGAMGYLASQQLNRQILLFQEVVRSIDMSRELADQFNTFLNQASNAQSKKVLISIDAETAALDTIEKLTSGKAGALYAGTEIAPVKDIIDSLKPKVMNLMEIENRRTINLSALTGARVQFDATLEAVNAELNELDRSLKHNYLVAKDAQRQAEAMKTMTEALLLTASDFASSTSPSGKLKGLQDNLIKVRKLRSQANAGMPPGLSANVEKLNEMIATADAIFSGSDSEDAKLAKADTVVRSIGMLRLAYAAAQRQKLVQTTEFFNANDNASAKFGPLLEDLRSYRDRLLLIRAGLTQFLSSSTDDELKHFQSALQALDAAASVVAWAEVDFPRLKETLEQQKQIAASANKAGQALVAALNDRDTLHGEARDAVTSAWRTLSKFTEALRAGADQDMRRADLTMLVVVVLGLLFALIGGTALVFALQKPLSRITASMRRLAEGDLGTQIEGKSRRDEVGEMARALEVFRHDAIAKQDLEIAAGNEREAVEAERRENDRERQVLASQIDFAVSALAGALGHLANGRLDAAIDTPFEGKLDQLRLDFNSSVTQLNDTLCGIMNNAIFIQQSGSALLGSAGEFSHRAEVQAASLEETAAAVEEITATVRASAERAHEANVLVKATKQSADASATVVENAMSAMARIETAAKQIEQIIDVIDNISFQTNLLALNAGIEAARAGEAGRGFAVVAQEVRELAQRSAEAAREIKTLIAASSAEVEDGTRQVFKAGKVLADIGKQIMSVSQHVEAIATSARDQSSGLEAVNTSVNSMDQITQHNASAASDTMAASRNLSYQADQLMILVQRFQLKGEDGSEGEDERAAA